ncbi:MAG: hypothetical protein AB7I52_10415 [Rhizobiaceae bacterium]
MRNIVVLAFVAAGFAGCTVTKLDYRTMTPEELAKSPDFMPIFPTAPDRGVLIGPVTAQLCQHSPKEPKATKEAAINELKRTAAMRGARALAGVSMREGFARIEECYSSAEATGTAYAIPNP